MKKILTVLLLLTGTCAFAYNDHRGHNLDSLELVVSKWTADKILKAPEDELLDLNRAYRDLMIGNLNINGEKSMYYARAALGISERFGWEYANWDCYRYLGIAFYGREQFDSARVYFDRALSAIDRMESGARSIVKPDGYTQLDLDDSRSALYGAIGNLCNVQDSIPEAMAWYEKAGEIFDKYGWNESNSILYYNIGETWVEQGDFPKAKSAYGKALHYAQVAGDSLMIASAYKGFGYLYSSQGKTSRALRYLQMADEYYINHAEQEKQFRLETMDYMSQVLAEQKKHLTIGLIALIIIVLLAIASAIILRRLSIVRKEQSEAAEVIEETLEEIRSSSKQQLPKLNDREEKILDLIAKGHTNPQIADEICLSPETIKWYRKKLLVKFDAVNSAELISKAKSLGHI